jgi:glycosyltransferase involved in cell wall biosynthesis
VNTLIIPAYNESDSIANVLGIVTKMSDFQEIIVVDDGSVDATSEVAGSFGVRVIRLQQNAGKGGAIAAGMRASDTPFVTLLDADLLGLKPSHIHALASPVLNGEAVMSLGLFASGRKRTDWAQKIAPSITGQRVLQRQVLETLPDLETARFGVDYALTKHVKNLKLPIAEVFLHDLSQRMKEEKLGLARGTAARMKMYWEILRVFAK